MKKKLKITIIALTIITLIILLYTLVRSDELKFRDDYTLYNFATYSNGKSIEVNIPSKNNVRYVKGKNVVSLMKKETGIFYFGYTSCPWCRNVVETVIEVSRENNLPIYYIDSKKLSKEDLKSVIEYLKEYLRKSDSGKDRLYVPDVYFVEDGNIINHHIGTIDSQTNPFNKLEGKDKKELKDIYLDFIKEMNK